MQAGPIPLNASGLSAGIFVRGLWNLDAMLVKAQAHAEAVGRDETTLLHTRLADATTVPAASHDTRRDLHRFPLAAQAHWAAASARLAIQRLLGESAPPAPYEDAARFSDLRQHLGATILYLEGVPSHELDAGLDRTVTIQHPRGATRASGSRFLLAFAIPHFHYHLVAAYSILRQEGVPLSMGDFLGQWGRSNGE